MQFYYILVPSTGIFSSINEKLRIMLIDTLIEVNALMMLFLKYLEIICLFVCLYHYLVENFKLPTFLPRMVLITSYSQHVVL